MTLEQIYHSAKNDTLINQKISQTILEMVLRKQKFDLSITELSVQANCSQPSITRYVRHLGNKSYKNFIRKINEEIMHNFVQKNSDYTLTEARCDIIKSVVNTLNSISDTDVRLIAELINQANKINFVWMGGNYSSFVEMEHKLSQIGKHVMVAVDWHQQLINLSYMDSHDLLLAISYSGDKKETNLVVERAKLRGIPVVVFTGDFDSTLKEKADYVVNIVSHDPKYRSFSFAAKPALIAVWQLIFKEILSLRDLSQEIVEAWRWQIIR